MTMHIRPLETDDYKHVQSMETGIEDDYIPPIFLDLLTPPHALFGLFVQDQLACFAGYTVFSEVYVMLGRLRSDRRMRGRGYATKLMHFVVKQALNHKRTHWIGANTEVDNVAAQRVLENIHLKPYPTLTIAKTKHFSSLPNNGNRWQPIKCLKQKKAWLHQTYHRERKLFPFQPYYPFPASIRLFQDEIINQWNFYENNDKTRFFILKKHQIGESYVQLVYPFLDLFQQDGLWRTIQKQLTAFQKEENDPLFLWVDLTEDQRKELPASHPFELSTPWVLYGKKASELKALFLDQRI